MRVISIASIGSLAACLSALLLVEPTLGQIGEACSLCTSSAPFVGRPDILLTTGTAGVLDVAQTCGETEAQAQAGEFSTTDCVLLRAIGVGITCGCQEEEVVVAPTDSPAGAVEPTDAPAGSVETEAPVGSVETDAPAVAPTEAAVEPTAAPGVATEAPTVAPEAATVSPMPTITPVVANVTAAPVALDTLAPSAGVTTTLTPVATNVTEAPIETLTPNATSPPGEVTLAPNVTVAPNETTAPPGETLPPVDENVTSLDLSGDVVVRLESTTGELSLEDSVVLSEVCDQLFDAFLPESITNIFSTLTTQNFTVSAATRRHFVRRLQEPDVNVTIEPSTPAVLGVLYASVTVSAVSSPPADSAEFSQTLQDIIDANAANFTSLLQSRSPAFADVVSVSAQELGSSPTTPVPASTVTSAPVEATTGAPVATPSEPPVAPTPTAVAPAAAPSVPTTRDTTSDDDDGLSGGAIAGIAVAVVAAIALLVGAGYYANKQSTPAEPVRPVVGSTIDETLGARPTTRIKPVGGGSSVASTTANPAAVAAVAAVAAGAGSMISSQASGGGGSMAGGSNDPSGIKPLSKSSIGDQGGSVMAGSTEIDGGDAMSYTYSLDAGNVDQASAAAGGRKSTGDSAHDATSQSGDEMSSHAMSSLRQNMVSRTVVAPPGKLGIVIDTTLEGPVVHKINPQSPLEGILFPGDIIVAIDDVDTRAMSASAITALMVRTANLRRKLTVLSEDVTN